MKGLRLAALHRVLLPRRDPHSPRASGRRWARRLGLAAAGSAPHWHERRGRFRRPERRALTLEGAAGAQNGTAGSQDGVRLRRCRVQWPSVATRDDAGGRCRSWGSDYRAVRPVARRRAEGDACMRAVAAPGTRRGPHSSLTAALYPRSLWTRTSATSSTARSAAGKRSTVRPAGMHWRIESSQLIGTPPTRMQAGSAHRQI